MHYTREEEKSVKGTTIHNRQPQIHVHVYIHVHVLYMYIHMYKEEGGREGCVVTAATTDLWMLCVLPLPCPAYLLEPSPTWSVGGREEEKSMTSIPVLHVHAQHIRDGLHG